MVSLETATKDKHKKYDEDCKEWGLDFKVFALTTFGGYSPEALQIIKKLIHCTAIFLNEPISTVADSLYRKISLVLQRDIARAIITRIPKPGHKQSNRNVEN